MLTPFILILTVLGVVAGTLGSLLGLGGSLILVPILTVMGFPIAEAVAAGLICIIATSVSASSVYLKAGWADIRVAQPLQIATVLGGTTGAWFAPMLPAAAVKLFFAGFLIYGAWLLWNKPAPGTEDPGPDIPGYTPRNHALGAAACYGVGNVSGVLGIGGGPILVPLMHLGMGLPMKAATATSAFLMGVTATAAGLLYYMRGDLVPALTAPLALGVLIGAQIGSRLARRFRSRTLQRIFVVILLALAGLLIRTTGVFD